MIVQHGKIAYSWLETLLLPNSGTMKSMSPELNDKAMILGLHRRIPKYSLYYIRPVQSSTWHPQALLLGPGLDFLEVHTLDSLQSCTFKDLAEQSNVKTSESYNCPKH